ncbi:MAG: YhgE/Pip family protein, partial [Phoenicibacter congonensis]|nr:YhgE/Pip family protein [Phoenicibacter congonensis]
MWRLIKAPTALIVVAALIILPSLYTWVNVYGFWNPYDNTANMRVCFVNEDKGGTNELTGELNLGNMIDETLHDNHQLGWAFMSREEAMEEVQSGKAYAAFIVPENFTENLLTLFSSDFEEPKIQYYVNEKLGAVSPKVTDAGSTTLDETINSTFVQTVSETVVNKLNDAIGSANEAVNLKDGQVVQKIESARNAITNTNTSLVELEASIDSAQTKVANSKSNLYEVSKGIDEIEASLNKVKESSQKVS